MQNTDLDGIDLGYRPKSYFWPLGLATHLLSRIKGAKRRAALKRLIDSGRLEDIPDYLAQSKLGNDERRAVGLIHPAFMGGEYLPDVLPNEVMVARTTIASVTRDVTCVYARRTKHRMLYRVVDEYQGDTLSERRTRTSIRPLTLGQLSEFFSGAWSIFDVLEMNFADEGYDIDEMQAFVLGIESEFYPQLDGIYRRQIAAWGESRKKPSDDPDTVQPVVETEKSDDSSPATSSREYDPIANAMRQHPGLTRERAEEIAAAFGY